MTKQVRIENADSGLDFKVQVEIWDVRSEGNVLTKTEELNYPTAMLQTYITDSRYLVIKELKPDVKKL